jgi:hypothetical protein
MNPRSLRYAISLWWYQTFVCNHGEWEEYSDHGKPYIACHQCGNAWDGSRRQRFLRKRKRVMLRQVRQLKRRVEEIKQESDR